MRVHVRLGTCTDTGAWQAARSLPLCLAESNTLGCAGVSSEVAALAHHQANASSLTLIVGHASGAILTYTCALQPRRYCSEIMWVSHLQRWVSCIRC